MSDKRKPPAFLLYVDDFISGTCEMTTEERGAYIVLLCYQWSRGSIPPDPAKLARIAGCEVSQDVMSKFALCNDGLLRNERLESVRQNREEFCAKQAGRGRAGAEKRWGKNSERHSERHSSENGSTDSNSDGSVDGKKNGFPIPFPIPSPVPYPNPQRDSVPEAPKSNWQDTTDKPAVIGPSLKDVQALGEVQGIDKSICREFWQYYDAQGWVTAAGQKIVNWRSKLAAWANRKRSEGGNKPPRK
jgi:uncharacterized protein YdaU (DUF1376 family)